jgi:hypothetical protein
MFFLCVPQMCRTNGITSPLINLGKGQGSVIRLMDRKVGKPQIRSGRFCRRKSYLCPRGQGPRCELYWISAPVRNVTANKYRLVCELKSTSTLTDIYQFIYSKW